MKTKKPLLPVTVSRNRVYTGNVGLKIRKKKPGATNSELLLRFPKSTGSPTTILCYYIFRLF